MPMAPRETLPLLMIWLYEFTARLMGSAKPMPSKLPLPLTIMVLMPITSPLILSSGPPLLLRLMAALAEVAAFGADDAGGHGLIESEGRADGDRPVADFDGVGVADAERRELLAGVDLQDREVQLGIGADQLSRVLGPVAGQRHLNADGVLDNVVVGQDIAVVVHDKAGAQALRATRLLRRTFKRVHAAKRILTVGWLPVEEPPGVRALFLNRADDLHDGRLGFLGDLGERVG